MSSGTDGFGSGQYGAGGYDLPNAEPGPGAAGRAGRPGEPDPVPADAPWLVAGAGSVGYAEAVFGGREAAGRRAPRPNPGNPQQPGPRQPGPGGPQQDFPDGYAPHQQQGDYSAAGFEPGQYPAGDYPQGGYPEQDYQDSQYPGEYPEQGGYPEHGYPEAGGQRPGGFHGGPAHQGPEFSGEYQDPQYEVGPGRFPDAGRQSGPVLGSAQGYSGPRPGDSGEYGAPAASFDAPTTEFFPGPMFDEPAMPGAQHGPGGTGGTGSWGVQAPHPQQQPPGPAGRPDASYGPGPGATGPAVPDEPVPGPAPLPSRGPRADRQPPNTRPRPADAPKQQPQPGPQQAGPQQPQQQPQQQGPGRQQQPQVAQPQGAPPQAVGVQAVQQQTAPAPAAQVPQAAAATAAPPTGSGTRETLTPPRRASAQSAAAQRAAAAAAAAAVAEKAGIPFDLPPMQPAPRPQPQGVREQQAPQVREQAQQKAAEAPQLKTQQTQAQQAQGQAQAQQSQVQQAQSQQAQSQQAQSQQAQAHQAQGEQSQAQQAPSQDAAAQAGAGQPQNVHAAPEQEAPEQSAAQQAPAGPQRTRGAGGTDLTSERLRSVAPVPAQRSGTAAQERGGEASRSGAYTAGAPAADDADEMIVPWQAPAQGQAAPKPAQQPQNPQQGQAQQQAQQAPARQAPEEQQDPAAQSAQQASGQQSPEEVGQAQAPRGTRRKVGDAAQDAAADVQAQPQGQAQAPQAQVAQSAQPQAAQVQQPEEQQQQARPAARNRATAQAQAAKEAAAADQAAQQAAQAQQAGQAQQAAQVQQAAQQTQQASALTEAATALASGTGPAAAGRPARGRQQAPAQAAAPAAAQQEQSASAAPAQQVPQRQQQPGADNRAPGYDDQALAAVYRVIHERRDVRNDFLPDEVPTEVLTRVLEAAHTAPSVGFSQPWDFVIVRDEGMRQAVHDLAVRQRRAYAASLPKARAKAFATLKIEAILDTPVNIVVTCDPTRGGRHTLGRFTQPTMAPFSSVLAVENLWLAARAEGLGVGWVSFFDERELSAVLGLPAHLQIVAYLCVGYVKQFPPEPELAAAGWAGRRPLAWAVHEERFGRRALPGAEPVSLLSETVDSIRGLDPEALAAARDRQSRMTKPPGSLGALEAVAEQLAGLSGQCPPPMPEPAAIAVFAGDHGVHAQGVTPWPQEVTAQMVANFLAGGAVVNAFAKQVGAEVCVIDVGVAADLPTRPGLVPRKIRYGTADMTQGPAMTREEACAALEAGIETARDLVGAGNRCLLTGDMGITNTTASAALIAAFTGASPAQVTGYGTGIDEQTYAHKVDVVARALALHRPDLQDPVGVLAAFGGLEHAALAGFILGAAAMRVPVVLDGVIAGAAALVAQALSPDVTVACVAGHRSAEPGHGLALDALGVTPLIDLELRLGEGSGAALALPLVAAAVRALREVATFDDAGVSDASEASTRPPHERDRAQ